MKKEYHKVSMNSQSLSDLEKSLTSVIESTAKNLLKEVNTTMDVKLYSLDEKFTAKIDALGTRLDQISKRFDDMDLKLETYTLALNEDVQDHEKRIKALEKQRSS